MRASSIRAEDFDDHSSSSRVRAKREKLKSFEGLLSERQGQNLALTVFYVRHIT